MPKVIRSFFCHDINASIISKTLVVLQEEFGNDGYAVWFKILEMLGASEDNKIHIADSAEYKYFEKRMGCDGEKLGEILEMLVEMGAIDSELYNSGIIYSENFYQRMEYCAECKGKKVPILGEEISARFGKDDTPKKAFAEFVRLTESEYGKLCEDIGQEAANEAIRVLDNYKGSSGRKYRSDYRAMLNWVIPKIRKEHPMMIKNVVKKADNPFAEWSI